MSLSGRFRVRFAELKETPALARFQTNSVQEIEERGLDITVSQKGIEHIIQTPALGRYYVIENKKTGEPVGCFMITYEWEDWENKAYWWVQSVYITPAYRKLGLFKFAYDFVKGEAIKDQALGLRLMVNKSNASAKKVYESAGMIPSDYELYEEMLQPVTDSKL